MIDAKTLDDMAKKLSELLPPNAKNLHEDLKTQFKQVLQTGLSKMDLVTREEFDVQAKVLARTRERVEALEKIVAELESTSNS